MLMTGPARTTSSCSCLCAKQMEFDAAFLRLQERCEPLSRDRYHDLTNEQKGWLLLLEDDCDELKRCDQEILREHALSRGIDLGKDAYRKSVEYCYIEQPSYKSS